MRKAKDVDGLGAQDAFIAAYQFPACAADALSLRRKFNATEFDFVAEVVKYATSSGFPYDVAIVIELMQSIVAEDGRVDTVTGEPHPARGAADRGPPNRRLPLAGRADRAGCGGLTMESARTTARGRPPPARPGAPRGHPATAGTNPRLPGVNSGGTGARSQM